MKTLISIEYGLTISGHVTVLRQWLSEKNTDYIIKLNGTFLSFSYLDIKCDIDKKHIVIKYTERKKKHIFTLVVIRIKDVLIV